MGVYFSESHSRGGVGKLRIKMRKVKDLVNNASILAIFSLELCNFFWFIIFDFCICSSFFAKGDSKVRFFEQAVL